MNITVATKGLQNSKPGEIAVANLQDNDVQGYGYPEGCTIRFGGVSVEMNRSEALGLIELLQRMLNGAALTAN